MTNPASSDNDRQDDAHRLHEAGYTRRAVWAKWVLDDFKTLHWHLTEDGQPVKDDGNLDLSFYLSADEWDEVAATARRISELSVQIANLRRLGRDE